MNPVRKGLAALLGFLKDFLRSHPKIRLLLYDLMNRNEFANLYEHEKMLADSVRVDTYQKAIEKHIRTEDVILDLGTGTGILSFLAARKNPKKIYAIDHSEFIEVARNIAKHNNIKNIEFINVNSRNFNPGAELDVIIHEQIGDYLFNENMINNILDIKHRLLKPSGRIMPGKFELFLEPVCLEKSFSVPFIYEQSIHGIDFGFLKSRKKLIDRFRAPEYGQEWLGSAAVKHFLCERKPILTFDLNELSREDEIPKSIEVSKQVVNPGYLHCLCLFFKVIFDDEVNFDTSPLSARTHWGNCFFRVEGKVCRGGEVIDCTLNMQDLLDIRTWAVATRFREPGSQAV